MQTGAVKATQGRRPARAVCATALVGLVGVVAVSAQPRFTADIDGALAQLGSESAGGMSQGGLGASVAPELGFHAQAGRVFYTLDGATPSGSGDWGYLSHNLGAAYRLDLAKNERMRLFVGADGTLRRNETSWESADYDAWGGFVRAELRPWQGALVRSGVRLDERTLPRTSPLTHTEIEGLVSLNLSFATRTSVLAEVRRGSKAYAGGTLDVLEETPVAGADASALLGTGRGRGRVARSIPTAAHETEALTSVATTPTVVDPATAHATTWLVRIAQSLAKRTGLMIQYQQRNPSGDAPPLGFALPQQFLDDGIYDDPYASELRAWRVQLKHVASSGVVAQLQAGRERRQYVAALATDANGVTLAERLDRLTRASAEISIPFLPKHTGSVALTLRAQYSLLLSHSNDAAYDYRAHSIGAGLRIAF